MPIVVISLLSGRSEQQKEDLAASIARSLVDIARADPSTIEILYQEYEPANWIKFGPDGVRHASRPGAKAVDGSR